MSSGFSVAAALSAGTVRIVSLDDGTTIFFPEVSESGFQWKGGADWREIMVAQASPVPSEYSHTRPQEVSWRFTLNDYTKHGLGGSVEGPCKDLMHLTERVPGRKRAHKVKLFYLSKTFGPAVVMDVSLPVWRVNTSGEALIVKEGEVVLKRLPA